MYMVYSTTKSFELYPDKVLIVVGEPGVAEKLPERLVVIPTSVPPPPDIPVKLEPSPYKVSAYMFLNLTVFVPIS